MIDQRCILPCSPAITGKVYSVEHRLKPVNLFPNFVRSGLDHECFRAGTSHKFEQSLSVDVLFGYRGMDH